MEKNNATDALTLLKEQGIRVTPQRLAILEFIYYSNSHPSADEIFTSLGHTYHNMSMATVYNNLNALKEAGLISEISHGSSSTRYDGNTSNHYHLICNNCENIEDLQYPVMDDIENYVSTFTNFRALYHSTVIYGFCNNCQ